MAKYVTEAKDSTANAKSALILRGSVTARQNTANALSALLPLKKILLGTA